MKPSLLPAGSAWKFPLVRRASIYGQLGLGDRFTCKLRTWLSG
jgi:hypothetical protein